MLFYDAFERSSNPHIASIVEPCVSQNQKQILAMWVWLRRKSWKRVEATEKVCMSWKQNLCVCVCGREKKLTALKLLWSFLRYIKNVNLQFKKDFKSAELLTKTYFFLYFRDRSKNGEWNKGDVDSICARVTKHASKCLAKAEVNLNWFWTINYGLFPLYI